MGPRAIAISVIGAVGHDCTSHCLEKYCKNILKCNIFGLIWEASKAAVPYGRLPYIFGKLLARATFSPLAVCLYLKSLKIIELKVIESGTI